MTTRELHGLTMTMIDFRNSGFSGIEWNDHARNAQEEWLMGLLPKTESDQGIDDRLQSLEVLDEEISMVNGVASLPTRYRRLTGLWILISQVSAPPDDEHCQCPPEEEPAGEWVKVRRLTNDQHGYRANDPFSRPSVRKPYRKIADGKINILTAPKGNHMAPGTTVSKAKLSYVREPDRIALEVDEYGEIAGTGSGDKNSSLPDHCLLEIAAIISRRLLEAIESTTRYQTQLSEQQIQSQNSISN